MANNTNQPAALEALLNEKLAALEKILEVTRKELLLVDLDKLTPLLEQKDQMLARITRLDEQIAATGLNQGKAWEGMPQHEQMGILIQAILENDAVLEERMKAEFSQLRSELREFNKEKRLKKYLEDHKPRKTRVDLKR